MTINFDATNIFPSNVVQLVSARFAIEDSRLTVLKRPLRTQDPNFSIGVWANNWQPVPHTNEMLGIDFARQSTLEQYVVYIQGFCRNADEIAGLNQHCVMAESIRSILATDGPLREQLGGLTAVLNGQTKSLKKFWVRAGRYVNNQVNGENMYLTTNDLMLEVENLHA